MDYFEGISAEVLCNEQVLDLYESPNTATIEEVRARHQYVEAVPGTTFQVRVNLTSEFNFYQMKAQDAVEIIVEVDGCDDTSLRVFFTKKEIQEEFSTGETIGQMFTGPDHYCMQTEQWMRSDYCFSNLILSMVCPFASSET